MGPDQNKNGLMAVGAYLRRLRTHRRMTPTVTAAYAGTDPSMLNRIEKGNIDTRGSLLLALTRTVGGNMDDIQHLMHDRHATAATGEQRANRWIAFLETVPSPDELQQLSQLLAAMTALSAGSALATDAQRQHMALLRAVLSEWDNPIDDPSPSPGF
jgi:transcriptional regulator with XRE-family HTH domain